jgi:hypothetical protein
VSSDGVLSVIGATAQFRVDTTDFRAVRASRWTSSGVLAMVSSTFNRDPAKPTVEGVERLILVRLGGKTPRFATQRMPGTVLGISSRGNGVFVLTDKGTVVVEHAPVPDGAWCLLTSLASRLKVSDRPGGYRAAARPPGQGFTLRGTCEAVQLPPFFANLPEAEMAAVRSLLAFEQRIGQTTGLTLRDWSDSRMHDQFVVGGAREAQRGRPPSQPTAAPAPEKKAAVNPLQAEFENAMDAGETINIIERARNRGIELRGIENWLPIVAKRLLDPDPSDLIGELQDVLSRNW